MSEQDKDSNRKKVRTYILLDLSEVILYMEVAKNRRYRKTAAGEDASPMYKLEIRNQKRKSDQKNIRQTAFIFWAHKMEKRYDSGTGRKTEIHLLSMDMVIYRAYIQRPETRSRKQMITMVW